MTKEKVWKFKYKDVIATTRAFDSEFGKEVDFNTAKNLLGWNVVIDKDKNDKDCYIYSDQEITGLELVGENVRLGE